MGYFSSRKKFIILNSICLISVVSEKAVQVGSHCFSGCTMYLHKASNVAAIQGSFFFLFLKYLLRKEITQAGVLQKKLIIAENL